MKRSTKGVSWDTPQAYAEFYCPLVGFKPPSLDGDWLEPYFILFSPKKGLPFFGEKSNQYSSASMIVITRSVTEGSDGSGEW
jgi:hypothetical protein